MYDALFLAAALLMQPTAAADAFSAAARNDARLNDVFFIDRKIGFAVGDRGVILHTADGGTTWTHQTSGVQCPLRSVHFVDRDHGWAAGGWTEPYTHKGRGVVLCTRDGGRRWELQSQMRLPAVRELRMWDFKRGWLLASPSAMHPSGLFQTENGGQSFTAVAAGPGGDWRAADLVEPGEGVVAAGRQGIVPLRHGEFQGVAPVDLHVRAIARVRLQLRGGGYAVGDGGLVLRSTSTGPRWQATDTLPAEAADFDFHGLALSGRAAWVAGTPGSRVFFTHDDGTTWQSAATGVNVPIHALHFVDAEHGWAVGSLGTILATADGGRSWQRQRAGGARLAALVLLSNAHGVPLETLARVCNHEGYLAAVEVLTRQDLGSEARDESPLAERLREAVLGVGGSDAALAWQCPVRDPELRLSAAQTVAAWDRLHDGQALRLLEAHLVRQVRLWQPEIVITHDASPRVGDPLDQLIAQVTLQAIVAAADESRYAEQIDKLGLRPWQVKKVFAVLPPGERGTIDVAAAQFAPRIGRTLAEAALAPRALLADRYSPAAAVTGFRSLYNHAATDAAQRDFFTGLVLNAGGEARRELGDAPAEALGSVRRAAERRRNLQAILDRMGRDGQSGSILLGQIGELTLGLDSDAAAHLLYQLADRYHSAGRWQDAIDAYGLLAERHAAHPLGAAARAWLVKCHASSEVGWRLHGPSQLSTAQLASFTPDVKLLSARSERTLTAGRELERSCPEMFAEPTVRYPLAAAHRAAGLGRMVDRFYVMQIPGPQGDAWRRCAQAEAWLSGARPTAPPLAILACTPAAGKPRLDGKLDDDVWSRAKPVKLASPEHDDETWPATVSLAYDAEFLYVAMQCQRAAPRAPRGNEAAIETPRSSSWRGASGSPLAPWGRGAGGEGRPRDADLSSQDRVELLLDLDRDYTTWYRFAIDHRGWLYDECWGDKSWNPVCYVAADQADDHWTVEAAIPWIQLCPRPPRPGTTWAISLKRIVPGVGMQSWTGDKSTTPGPESFGLMTFE